MSVNADSAVVPIFKYIPVLNDAKSTKEGRPIYDDTEIVEIKMAANKQTVGVFPAHEVCGWVDGLDGVRSQQTYAMKYNAQYLAFKNGEGQAIGGTPLEALDFLTPSKRLELKALNIYTAESLASLDGAALKRLGMGGRDLKNQAVDYLANAGDQQLQHVSDVVAQQDARIAELEARLAGYEGKAPAQDPLDHDGNGRKGGAAPAQTKTAPAKPAPTQDDAVSAEDALKLADGNFMAFKSAAKKVLGDSIPSTKDDIIAALQAHKPAEPSPFEDFEDADIRNWLKEAAPTLDTSGFDRPKLIEAADEANRALAEKNKG